MMRSTAVVSVMFMLAGCSSATGLSETHRTGSLRASDEVKVIEAVVDNPYPDCRNANAEVTNADLSIPRSIRGYLNHKGELCKKVY